MPHQLARRRVLGVRRFLDRSIGMSDCKHDGIATYRLLDGTPAGMWGCTQCARKFVPLDLVIEAQAKKWRQLEAAALDGQSRTPTKRETLEDRLQQFGSM